MTFTLGLVCFTYLGSHRECPEGQKKSIFLVDLFNVQMYTKNGLFLTCYLLFCKLQLKSTFYKKKQVWSWTCLSQLWDVSPKVSRLSTVAEMRLMELTALYLHREEENPYRANQNPCYCTFHTFLRQDLQGLQIKLN